MGFDPATDYPIGTVRPELATTPSGLPLAGITLAALREGTLDPSDVRATPETLRRQSEVALAAGRVGLAENLARAAELASVPAELLLEIYTALRPDRSTAGELDEWADRLEELSAPLAAAFVREARAAYAARGLLASGERTTV